MGWSAPDLTSRLLRHERVLVACTVALLTAIGWAYLLQDIKMAAMEPPLIALIAMWWLMMLAMMLPSAAPAILLYARVRRSRDDDATIAKTWIFLTGYLAVWLCFSIAAALIQSLAIDESMTVRDSRITGALLILAGVYQLSPLKSACIGQCRSPGQFISRHWRNGWDGAVRLGVIHGAYCVGCCWLLMTLLFVGGVMNLAWIIGLSVLVAGEKLLPAKLYLTMISGVALISWGLWMVIAQALGL
jgi:predicted metal-binding membrane protein